MEWFHIIKDKFVQDFSKIANLLTCLTRKGVKFEWNYDYEDGFLELKQRLTIALVLVIPNIEETYVVYIDASLNGMGCVLMQYGRVVAYRS